MRQVAISTWNLSNDQSANYIAWLTSNKSISIFWDDINIRACSSLTQIALENKAPLYMTCFSSAAPPTENEDASSVIGKVL